jgi:glycosyltransferase involved in cell wall biosynthesis
VKVEARARALGVAVEAPGWLDTEARDALFEGVDLLAMPSIWPEPFGLGGIELGMASVPAVAFDIGGIRDWLRPGVSGELASGSPPTAAGLADALVRALRDPEHTRRLGQGAYAVARAFSADVHVERLEAILTEAVASSSQAAKPR